MEQRVQRKLTTLISFCVFGINPMYIRGAVANAKLALEIYPGWRTRFYLSKPVYDLIADELMYIKNTSIVLVEAPENFFFTNYRFLVCNEPDIDVAIFRDTDSRLSVREAAAVSEWINSGKSLHIMRDHPWHFPDPNNHMMLAGMWGVRCDKLRNIADLLQQHKHDVLHGTDQRFLSKYVYPNFAKNNDILEHDEFFDKQHKFPTTREYEHHAGHNLPMFVGCQYDAYGKIININNHLLLDSYLKNNV